MSPNEFSGLLKARSISQPQIAKKLGLRVSQINNVIRGYSKSPKVRRALAEALGVDESKIDWPSNTRRPYKRCNTTILKHKNEAVKKKKERKFFLWKK